MQYGICHLCIVPVRSEADETSELLTQLLYGEHFKILEERKVWSKIRHAGDRSEGWVLNTQITKISEKEYAETDKAEQLDCSRDLVSFVSNGNGILMPIVLGSSLHNLESLGHCYEGEKSGAIALDQLVNTAVLYLNAPYLHGGRSPFGIDASGLTQMVYKMHGVKLSRKAEDQAMQGEALSFIEESSPGDLAFFDNKEGLIDHVGIIMKDNHIIHAFGKVRIDRIDHTGIFNSELRNYSHKLRVIKKIK